MLCFRIFPVAKKIMSSRGGGGYQDFTSNFFCLTMPQTPLGGGEFFSVLLISVIEKVWILVVGGVSRFYIEKFLPHSAEKFPQGTVLLLQ